MCSEKHTYQTKFNIKLKIAKVFPSTQIHKFSLYGYCKENLGILI